MATIEFINKRIAGKEKEIAALEKKLSRILKAKESNWEKNPYYYNESDLTCAQRNLDSAKTAKVEWEEELAKAIEKKNSRNVPAITEFLDKWEINAIAYYLKKRKEYLEEYKVYCAKNHEFCEWFNCERIKLLHTVSIEEYNSIYKEKNRDFKEYEKNFKAKWRFITQFNHGDKNWEDTMKEDIAKEKDIKYDFIIDRTNEIVGTITDASNLHIGPTGELNGFIIGDRGKAKVETIGAGGYNIQCFHFRTLINKMGC